MDEHNSLTGVILAIILVLLFLGIGTYLLVFYIAG